MEDAEILALYFARDEGAIRETEEKYGRKLRSLAVHLTGTDADGEECVNDTYLAAWNHIPPARPEYFFAYLAKITRNFALKQCDRQSTQKRSVILLELSGELAACIPDKTDVWTELRAKELEQSVARFVAACSEDMQTVFLRRYFWSDSIEDIAVLTGMSVSKVKSLLFRARRRLRASLEEDEFFI